MGLDSSGLLGGAALQPDDLVVMSPDAHGHGHALEVVRPDAHDQMAAQPVDQREGEFQARCVFLTTEGVTNGRPVWNDDLPANQQQ